MPSVFSGLTGLVLVLLGLYCAVLAWLWFKQESLLFFPEVLPARHQFPPQLGARERAIEVPGARLSALHLQLPDPKGVVFFLHGNGGSLAGWFTDPEFYRRANFDLLMLDYRGYGKSTGRIESEAQLRADVRAAWAQVAPQYRGKQVVMYGRSLGTALAAGLAVELEDAGTPPALTVLVSPYRSVTAMARTMYPWVPPFVLRYPMRTEDSVAKLRSPLLLVHGSNDALIPIAHSEALLAVQPAARLVRVEGAGHNDLQEFDSYRAAMARALAELPPAQ